jgi:uncharacterized protein (TIGR02246 family)
VTRPTVTDLEQITDLQASYAAAYDGREPERFARLFSSDGELVLPDGHTVVGTEALRTFAENAAAKKARTHHFMQNQRVSITGDHATGAAHVTAVSSLGDSVRLLIMGRYHDEMVRTPDGWRFQRRRIIALTAEDLSG